VRGLPDIRVPNTSASGVEGRRAGGYRVDIDGLRGVAVALVCLFHARLWPFGGGFVGVDVFFVISGFVITRVLLRDLDQGHLSLGRFFVRRIRRLAPAVTLMLVVSIGLFTLIYPPDYLVSFGQSVLAQSFLASNFYFWRSTNYFGNPDEIRPLLHTWTLSLEEQFYLVFAVAFVLLSRFRRATLFVAVASALCASLALSVIATPLQPNASFYLLPTRAWELLAGSLAAIWFEEKQRPPAWSALGANLLAGMGLLGILVASVAFDDNTPFPSIYAALPVAGAAAIVWANERNRTIASAFLSWRPLVFLGKISYSVYLWHWIAIVLVRWITFGAPSRLAKLTAILACVPIAYLSWRFVENPVRSKAVLGSTRQVVSFAALSTLATAMYGYLAYSTGGFPGRNPAAAAFESRARSPREHECFDESSRHDIRFCEIGDRSTGRVSFIAVGDSHALSMLPALETLASRYKLKGIFGGTSGCLPFVGAIPAKDPASVERCRLLNERSMQMARELHIRHVILTARWTYYTQVDPDDQFQAVTSAAHRSISVAESRVVFAEQLRSTVKAYAQIGVSVYVVLQVPQQRLDPQSFIFRKSLPALLGGIDAKLTGTLDLSQHEQDQSFVDGVFRSAAGIQTFDPASLLCQDASTCLMFADGQSLYFDANHLNVDGAQRVAAALEPIFAMIAADPDHSARSVPPADTRDN
jgi:peptidoglycan/LPS O-acetylase OafA/YrhL